MIYITELKAFMAKQEFTMWQSWIEQEGKHGLG